MFIYIFHKYVHYKNINWKQIFKIQINRYRNFSQFLELKFAFIFLIRCYIIKNQYV